MVPSWGMNYHTSFGLSVHTPKAYYYAKLKPSLFSHLAPLPDKRDRHPMNGKL
jgi:hypothetical protein